MQVKLCQPQQLSCPLVPGGTQRVPCDGRCMCCTRFAHDCAWTHNVFHVMGALCAAHDCAWTHNVLHVMGALCAAHDLHTIVPGPLEGTCWTQFAAQSADCEKVSNSAFFFSFFFFFAFPSYISGVHHFWVRFLRM